MARFAAGPARLVLCWAGRRAWFARNFPGMPLLPQGRGDLGARLARVTAALFAAGGGPVAVVGSDSPDLPLPLVTAAFAALATAEVAAIPSRDGGYALLALRRPAPALFAGIPWSTAQVLTATRARASALGLRFVTVGEWDDLGRSGLPAPIAGAFAGVRHCTVCAYASGQRAVVRKRLTPPRRWSIITPLPTTVLQGELAWN